MLWRVKVNRERLREIISEEFLKLMEFKLEDLDAEFKQKLSKFKDSKSKAIFLASLANKMGIPFNDMMEMIRKIYKDADFNEEPHK